MLFRSLFYHRGLQCLIAFELKADKFKPEHLGQLNFYLEMAEVRAANGAEAFPRGVLVVRALLDATLLVAGVDPAQATVPKRQTAVASWLRWLRRVAPTLP